MLERVQEAVALRMAARKADEQLAAKMAEAAAEANRAAEASRLLESLRRDFNESSLKGALVLTALAFCGPSQHHSR